MARAQARAEKKNRAEKLKRNKNRSSPYPPMTEKKDDKRISTGRCFNCGKRGHWADECPENKKSKISSFTTSFVSSTLINFDFSQSYVIENNQTDIENTQNSQELTYIPMCIDTVNKQYSRDKQLPVTPVGRLKINIEEWKSISSNSHVIDVIQHGYKIPFKTEPEEVVIKNNKSPLDNPEFVESEISSLLQKGCISKTFVKPKVVNPLTVAYNKSAKPKMVLDCRDINPHLFMFRLNMKTHL